MGATATPIAGRPSFTLASGVLSTGIAKPMGHEARRSPEVDARDDGDADGPSPRATVRKRMRPFLRRPALWVALAFVAIVVAGIGFERGRGKKVRVTEVVRSRVFKRLTDLSIHEDRRGGGSLASAAAGATTVGNLLSAAS